MKSELPNYQLFPSRQPVRLCLFGLIAVFALAGCSGQDETPADSSQQVLSFKIPDAILASKIVGGTRFTNGQAAAFVVGQTDFTSFGAGVGAAVLDGPFTSAHTSGGSLYISDFFNNRVLVFNSIPASNGAAADFALGQPDLTSNSSGTSATTFTGPQSPVISGGKLFLADYFNNRVGIYNTVPTASPGTIDVVVGQSDKVSFAPTCSATGLNSPETVSVFGNQMVVTDSLNHRVLIWNNIPTADGTPADLVLGQTVFTSCASNAGGSATASTLSTPSGAWTDGTRLAVIDSDNNRVLIWNSFPTSNGQAADLVLGQTNFTSVAINRGGAASAGTLNFPYEGIDVNNDNLFVADQNNNRVLIWKSFPTSNGQAADQVLGQVNFTDTAFDVTAATLFAPSGVHVSGTQLFISDLGNNRVLIYNSQVGVLTATITFNGQTQAMTISADGLTASVTLTNVPTGLTDFTIVFTFDLPPFGPLIVASATESLNVVEGNNTLSFASAVYDTSFDEDGDGLTNIVELDVNSTTNPLVFDPPLSCVLGSSRLGICTLGL